MIIRSLLRRPHPVQCFASVSASASARCAAPLLHRSLHSVPTLSNNPELQQNGIPGLFTPRQFDIAYTQYQQHMVDELNTSFAGSRYENIEPKSLVIELARNPVMAYGFNIASMAYNNHFFFRGLNTNPSITSNPSSELLQKITNDFSSLDTLRETFLATADAMFGPGFVWLVQTDKPRKPLQILTTYIAGSPLSGAHYRRQGVDLNTQNADSYQELNSAGAFGANAARQQRREQKPLGGIDVVPLLCVNTWEHVWLEDYGVGGKMKFLEKWWDNIDWNVVQEGVTFEKKREYEQDRFV